MDKKWRHYSLLAIKATRKKTLKTNLYQIILPDKTSFSWNSLVEIHSRSIVYLPAIFSIPRKLIISLHIVTSPCISNRHNKLFRWKSPYYFVNERKWKWLYIAWRHFAGKDSQRQSDRVNKAFDNQPISWHRNLISELNLINKYCFNVFLWAVSSIKSLLYKNEEMPGLLRHWSQSKNML